MAKRLCHEINLCSVKGAFKNHYQSYICVIKKIIWKDLGPFLPHLLHMINTLTQDSLSCIIRVTEIM